MSTKRRNFSKEFKARVVLDAIKERETLQMLAKKYELAPEQISRWKTEALKNFSRLFLSEGASKKEKGVDSDILYTQIGQLKVENDFLKKAEMRSISERRLMVETNHVLSLDKQCELLSIHRSGLYYKPVPESEENLKIMKLLDEQYFKTPFYGARKLKEWLRKIGILINIKRLRRLMKLINWRTIFREPKTTISDVSHHKYPYLLRKLAVLRKNHVWATDITYIPMKNGFMYLIAIIDLHTRFIVQWSLSNSMEAEWCAGVLEEAIKAHGKPEIFNSDQGSQFTSDVFINVLKKHEIRISMDGKGRALDNIFIERLWRSVKYENIYLNAYENGLDLYSGLNNYMEFYNNERLHQSLDYETPSKLFFAA